MAHPNVLSADTKLYCPAEPTGRMFPAGSEWPGDAWSDRPGGEPAGANATAGAIKDLIEANDRLDHMSGQLASKDHDLAVMASERDAANGTVADLEQRALAAEASIAAAEDAARGYMLERDQARSDIAAANAAKDAAVAGEQAARALVDSLTADLEAANQKLANLNTPPAEVAQPEAVAEPTAEEAPVPVTEEPVVEAPADLEPAVEAAQPAPEADPAA